ncbi:hypothetical protein F4553_007664 [Allocatelliglobosispora scoriae]|uniref:Polymerase nucleotidyl transferase domain-containing protein n=1 Tax=Allocatelliglobosispora scoriae TaxID=643052 RepID=A0A841C5K8_9ACTN|nr:nucleotidyltransferase domain-containing protein [Allocatelliglobosispora scoriae]MBB5874230.1 hypothetical protein [Allocatelliglobosispora scoriae]
MFSETVDRYLGQAADLIDGLYLHGSAALGDYRAGISDIDFVAVVGAPLSDDAFARLGAVHRALGGPHLDGIYVTRDELAAGPLAIGPTPYARAHRLHRAGTFEHNPVTWHTLAHHAVVAHGPPPSALAVWDSTDALLSYQRENLRGYWTGWVDGASWSLLHRGAAAWGVLGIPRLHHTLRTGRITSKTGAGEFALSTYDSRWHRIVTDALAHRSGQPGTYRNPFTRRRDAVRFTRMALDAALDA